MNQMLPGVLIGSSIVQSPRAADLVGPNIIPTFTEASRRLRPLQTVKTSETGLCAPVDIALVHFDCRFCQQRNCLFDPSPPKRAGNPLPQRVLIIVTEKL